MPKFFYPYLRIALLNPTIPYNHLPCRIKVWNHDNNIKCFVMLLFFVVVVLCFVLVFVDVAVVVVLVVMV